MRTAVSLGIAFAMISVAPNGIEAQESARASSDTPCPSAMGGTNDGVVRRRPGASAEAATPGADCPSDRLPRVTSQPMEEPAAVPDRWRLVEELGYRVDWLDSYQGYNPLKGDRPVFGDDFLSLTGVSGTLLEDRRIPSGTALGDSQPARGATRNQLFLNQSLSVDMVLYRGDTVFRPPDWQWRLTTVLSASSTRSGDTSKTAYTGALQALFFEKHLRDTSVHDDFDSVRLGIQTLTSDFRGFLVSDQPMAARLFGTRDNNVFQYNLALFRSLRKNAVSLNDIGAGLPRNDVLLANLYWQDFPRAGITSEIVGAYNRNHEPGTEQVLSLAGTANGPAMRTQHDYDVGYLGYGIDGHFGRLNATAMSYVLAGKEKHATFTGSQARVQAWFAAGELSVDFDRQRWRLSLLHASGDSNPHDRRATGFDGLTANPVFAGADSSFFIHQQLALGGAAFNLKSRNALLPTLNPASDGAQANFSNPGLSLVGLGLDWDPGPRLRLSFDANALRFDNTAALSALTLTPVPNNFGTELAVNAFWRPFTNQNVIVRVSDAALVRGPGYRALYAGGIPYSAFVFLTLTY
jgi:hypothetical protein